MVKYQIMTILEWKILKINSKYNLFGQHKARKKEKFHFFINKVTVKQL